ncbi:hypothetical protein FE257_002420 [Aspergillus nanangensis]|uniref:Uncharacterized protein n=1 Tax=Aspergillus nanangensis TaxID=2582783 RepID=A0AAD4GNA9_ASPNN|nr:hypothetical protein FE257_002420 [Aspergillus nanangensis]
MYSSTPTPTSGLLRLLPPYLRQFLDGNTTPQGATSDPSDSGSTNMEPETKIKKITLVPPPPTLDVNPTKLSQGDAFFRKTIDDILTDEASFDQSFDEYSGDGGVDDQMSMSRGGTQGSEDDDDDGADEGFLRGEDGKEDGEEDSLGEDEVEVKTEEDEGIAEVLSRGVSAGLEIGDGGMSPVESVGGELRESDTEEEDEGSFTSAIHGELSGEEVEEEEGSVESVVEDELQEDELEESEVEGSEGPVAQETEDESHGSEIEEDQGSVELGQEDELEESELEGSEDPVAEETDDESHDSEIQEDEQSVAQETEDESHGSEIEENEGSLELGQEDEPAESEDEESVESVVEDELQECDDEDEDVCAELTERDEEDIIFRSVDDAAKDDILLFIAKHPFVDQFPVKRSARRKYVQDIQDKAATAGMDEISIDFLIKYIRRTYMDLHEIYTSDFEGSSFGDEIDDPEPLQKGNKQRKRKRKSVEEPGNSKKCKRQPEKQPSNSPHYGTEQQAVAPSTEDSPGRIYEQSPSKTQCMQNQSGPCEVTTMDLVGDDETQEKREDESQMDHEPLCPAKQTAFNPKHIGAHTDEESSHVSHLERKQKMRRKHKDKRRADKRKRKTSESSPEEEPARERHKVNRDEKEEPFVSPTEKSTRKKRKKKKKKNINEEDNREKPSHVLGEKTLCKEWQEKEKDDTLGKKSPPPTVQADKQVGKKSLTKASAKVSSGNNRLVELQTASDKKRDLDIMSNDSFWNLDF